MKFPMLKLLPKKLLLTVTLLIIPYFIFSQEVELYTTPGSNSFTVPAGVTRITVEAWGAGGNGGQASGLENYCGGGGGGAYAKSVFDVTPGETFNLFVGDKSSSIDSEYDSWFSHNSILLAKAGENCPPNDVNGAAGGQASWSLGQVKIDGADGASGLKINGDTDNSYAGNGGDAVNTFGTGGSAAVFPSTKATDGLSPGGGGGGGISIDLGGDKYYLDEGFGANGQIKISYYVSTFPDFDGDGIGDDADLDNDNDGILDTEECGFNTTTIRISPSGANPISNTAEQTGGSPVVASAEGNPGPGGTTPHPSSFNVAGVVGAGDQIIANNTELRFPIGLFEDGLRLSLNGTDILYFDYTHYGHLNDFMDKGKFDRSGGGGWDTDTREGNAELVVTSDGSIKLMVDTNVNDAYGDPLREDALKDMDSSVPGFIVDNSFTFDIFKIGGEDFEISNTLGKVSGSTSKILDLMIIASVDACVDSDSDGFSNDKDTDSDEDGCADALEGTHSVDITDLNVVGGIIGDIFNNGVPILVGVNGQSDWSSTDSSRKGRCGGMDICFDGVDDYIGTSLTLSEASEFTFMAWVKYNKKSNGTYYLFGQENLKIYIDINGKISVILKTAGVNNTVSAESANGNELEGNVWSHIAITYDQNNLIKIYINGFDRTKLGQNPAAGNIKSTSTTIEIGGGTNKLNSIKYYDGSIVELKVFSKAISQNAIQKQVYQRIENVNGNVFGSIVPKQIEDLLWDDLELYLKFEASSLGGIIEDNYSNKDVNITLHNMTDIQDANAPLPFVAESSGTWSEEGVWKYGAEWKVEELEETQPWAIAELNENVHLESGAVNLALMGLLIPESSSFSINGSTDLSTGTGTGQKLTVSDYIELNGFVDLQGESQFFQNENVLNLVGTNGYLERDQQGTPDTYTYNYWSSPVSSNGTDFTLSNIMANINFKGGYDGSLAPLQIAEYWIYKFSNSTSGAYSQWSQVKSTGIINVGEGYTMKGPGTAVSNFQNYDFRGVPNNGTIELDLADGNGYLVGNPYPSALDADQFILDNQPVLEENVDGTGGTLLFWEHWGGGSHYLKDYQGGYAYYSIGGGVPAVSHTEVSQTGDGTKVPGRFIPVGQGFFVTAASGIAADSKIQFNNGQRAFYLESDNGNESLFMKSSGTVSQPKEHYQGRMKIRLGATMPKGYHRQILITVDERTTSGMDYGFEARLVDDLNSDMFWVLDDNKFVIQGIPKINRNTEIPLGFSMKSAGTMKIGIDALENVPEDHSIFIKELATGITYEISESIDFELELEAGDYFDKYALVFQPQVKSLEELALIEGVKIRMNNDSKQLEIHRLVDTNLETIEVYNFLGQRVGFWSPDNQHRYLELHFDKSAGVYIVKVNTQNGQLSKKVLVD